MLKWKIVEKILYFDFQLSIHVFSLSDLVVYDWFIPIIMIQYDEKIYNISDFFLHKCFPYYIAIRSTIRYQKTYIFLIWLLKYFSPTISHKCTYWKVHRHFFRVIKIELIQHLCNIFSHRFIVINQNHPFFDFWQL